MSLEHIFRSKAFFQIISFFISHPGETFYVRDLGRQINLDPGIVQRELVRLEHEGIVTSVREGKNKYFSLETTSPIVSCMKELLLSSQKYTPQAILTVSFEEHWITPLTISMNHNAWAALRQDKRFLQTDIGECVAIFHDNGLKFACEFAKMKDGSSEICQKVKQSDFIDTYNRTFELFSDKLHSQIKQTQRMEVGSEIHRKSIFELYRLGIDICQLGYIGVLLDFPTSYFSGILRQTIENKLSQAQSSYTSQQLLSLFTSPDHLTLTSQRELALLKLVEYYQEADVKQVSLNAINEQEQKAIEMYFTDFYWTSFGHFGFKKDMAIAYEEINTLLSTYTKQQLQDRLHELDNYVVEIKKKKDEVIEMFHFSHQDIHLFDVAASITYQKAIRLELLSGINAMIREYVEHISTKNNTPLELLYQSTLTELLEINSENTDVFTILSERQKSSVWAVGAPMEEIIYTGDEAKQFVESYVKEIEREVNDTEHFHGNVAYPGCVRGRVRILQSSKELDRVEEGDILVTQQTVPEMLPAMKKAAAFVTNSGGITCHAAIVARELKKPCIVGTHIATKVLKDGDFVEVDANKGYVTVLRLSA